MPKHTPGDWIVGVTVGKDGWPVFRLRDMRDPDPDGEEVKADRKLIEAAPALLVACCHALRYISGSMDDEQGETLVEKELRAAIAKASS